MKRIILTSATVAVLLLFTGVAMAHDGPQFVRVTIEYQVQDPSGVDPHGLKHLSPGVWVLIAADANNPRSLPATLPALGWRCWPKWATTTCSRRPLRNPM